MGSSGRRRPLSRRWRSSAHGPGTVQSSARGCRCVNGCGLCSNYCSARRRLQEVKTVLNDTWYSRDLPVLTAIAEKLERGSAPVDTEQLIDELGLTRQDLTAGLPAFVLGYFFGGVPARINRRPRPAPAGSNGGPPRFGCGISDREVARADHLPPQRPFDSRGEDHRESS